MVKTMPAMRDIRDVGSITGLERYPGGGHGNPLHYSALPQEQLAKSGNTLLP